MARPQVFDEQKVIEKALALFWENGFQSTSVRDLIDKTGLSNGSFFNSFKDKNKMYLKCLEKYMDVYMIRLDGLLLSDDPFREKMRKVCLYVSRKDPKRGNYVGCFHFNTVLDDSIDDRAVLKLTNEISVHLKRSMIKAVDLAKKRNELPSATQSVVFAEYFSTILSGLRFYLKTNPSSVALSCMIDQIVEHMPKKD